jgi:hypothetical protein
MNKTSSALQLLLGPDRRRIVAPDRKTIEDSLRALEQDKNGWVTLSWSNCGYVTAMPCVTEGFKIEIENGSIAFHSRIDGNPLSLQEVILVFAAFAVNDPTWIDAYAWEQVPLKEIDFCKSPDDTVQGKGIWGYSYSPYG